VSTPIFVSSSASLLRWSFWWSLSLVGDKRTLFTRRLTGPYTGARLPTKIFRSQVFFDNDPSSAASLRSATRKEAKGRLALGVLGSRGSRGNQPTTPVHQVDLRWDKRRSAGPGTGAHQTDHLETGAQYWSSPSLLRLLSSATRSSVSTILLLLPVFFLRPASRPDPERQPARYYSEGVQSVQWWKTVRPKDQSALERVDWWGW